MNDLSKSTTAIASTTTDALTIALRAYTERVHDENSETKGKRHHRRAAPSEWSLCFDTETTTDPAQRLRFGTFQVRRHDELYEQGIFHDHDGLTPVEVEMLQAYATNSGIRLLSVSEFIEEVLYGVGYDRRATIVGFNLPFDISRLASSWDSARLDMRDGFTFRLSTNKHRPRIQVKHISRRLSLIRFAGTRAQRTWRSERRRGEWVPVRRGFFVDVKTIAAALLSKSFKLGELAEFLHAPTQKTKTDKHGGLLTDEYIDYAVKDTQVTWECFRDLASRYASLQLRRTQLHEIFSEASLGKAIMTEMGIRPWRQMQGDFPKSLLGKIWGTYFGGRSEVNWRRVVRQVRYCDFLSMYSTVCTLMHLWKFMRADGIDWKDSTAEVSALLTTVKIDDLQNPAAWQAFCAIVEVVPDDEIFPVRGSHGFDRQYTIGSNHIKKGEPLWFSLADCIAATLRAGRSPKVLRAITFSPRGVQKGLRPVAIAGNPAYRIDPRRDDLFKRLIELRQEIKGRRDMDIGPDKERLDTEQNQLKIVASSTSYGMNAENIVDRMAEPVPVWCFGSGEEPFQVSTRLIEKPGTFYHPLMATLITAGARLMLTIAECIAAREGLDWVFCDTDSIALAKPDGMSDNEFNGRADAVQQWFVPLNPYSFDGHLLQTEKQNYRLHKGDATRELEPLYCFAVSSKRYVLFNLDARGRPVLRKASAHGLGHLLAPYSDGKGPREVPAPATKLSDIGVRRWEYDFWYRIALAALEGHPESLDWSGLTCFDRPAVSQYNATKPELLRLFDRYNEFKPLTDRVRPFNFLLAFQATADAARTAYWATVDAGGSRRTRKVRTPRPIAPYTTELSVAADHCFDRDTGKSVDPRRLKTYREVLAKYHLHPESKFLKGDWTDRGRLERRHVEVVGIVNIGKEANELEEQFYLGADPEAMPDYDIAPDARISALERIASAAKRLGRRQIAEVSGVSMRTLSSIVGHKSKPNNATVRRLLLFAIDECDFDEKKPTAGSEVLALARAHAKIIGLRRFASDLGFDAANLSKVLMEKRPASQRMIQRLATQIGTARRA